MPDPGHLKILRKGAKEWNAWREENPEIEPDLINADLKGADLNGANLNGADLNGAILGRHSLRPKPAR